MARPWFRGVRTERSSCGTCQLPSGEKSKPAKGLAFRLLQAQICSLAAATFLALQVCLAALPQILQDADTLGSDSVGLPTPVFQGEEQACTCVRSLEICIGSPVESPPPAPG